MRLNITHHTVYRYTAPVGYTIQQLRLTPRSEGAQRVLDWHISAPGRLRSQTDSYGNVVHILVLNRPHDEIRIEVAGTAEIDDNNWLIPADHDSLASLVFLQETPLTAANREIKDFARAHAGGLKRDPLDALHCLMHALRNAVTYRKGSTHVHSGAAEVLADGFGVCQDFAHLFIACCRSLGIPARYVSGYLYSARRVVTASHAWADAWVENLGWVGIDVTHRRLVTPAYLRLAIGRDYLDACPVRGVRRGGGVEAMDVKVQVMAMQQQ